MIKFYPMSVLAMIKSLPFGFDHAGCYVLALVQQKQIFFSVFETFPTIFSFYLSIMNDILQAGFCRFLRSKVFQFYQKDILFLPSYESIIA